MKVGFMGLTHLGLVYSTATASRGIEVIQFDPEKTVIDRLRRDDLGVSEDGLEELWTRTASLRTLSCDPENLSTCDLIFVTSDVSTDERGRSNLDAVENLVTVAARSARQMTPVVIRSQVPPGFCRSRTSAENPMIYHVETLVFASAINRAINPDRHIIGVLDATRPLPSVYQRWLDLFPAEEYVMSYESAELAKIAINLYLSASVSTTNSLAELCELLGATWDEIIPSLQSDSRIGKNAYLRPGLGISGGNLERDLETFIALSRRFGGDSRVIESFVSHSEYRKNYVSRVLRGLELASGSTVGILGLAYKPGTASLKNSPTLRVVEEHPSLHFVAHDPLAKLSGYANVNQVSSIDQVVDSSEVLLVMTPCVEYINLTYTETQLQNKIAVVDPFGVVHGETIRSSRVPHYVLGRSSES